MARPLAGIGIGLRRPFAKELLATERRVDFLEITPENWVCFGGKRRRLLSECLERWPAISHSVSLNIGGLDPLDGELLDRTAALCEELDAPFFSDHLCYSSVRGQPVHDLLPLPFTTEAIEHVAARVKECERRVGRPLVLENATFYSHMPGAEMDEAEFLRRTLAAADCGLLLDVNNVYVNSRNHGFDARAFIDSMPLERVRQLHLAGHTHQDGVIIDTHIGPIIDAVWELYEHTLRRAGRLIPTIIEWDQELPPVDEVLDEADRARKVAERALGRAEVA
ncbi:MAG: DUF692 domain-containing protein [Polyangia bacterium]